VEYAPDPIRKLAGIPEKKSQLQRRIGSLDSADVFKDAILPIMQSKCAACHNKQKKKGKLIVTSYDEMIAGGETAPGITPGNPVSSEIYRRITLPEGHEDFMPGEGKSPLRRDQVAIIEWWIEHEAPRSAIVSTLAPNETMVGIFEAFFGINQAPEINVAPADPAVLNTLAGKGFQIRKLAGNTNLLEVKAKDKKMMKTEIARLSALKDQTVWLDLNNCTLSEEDLRIIGTFPNLMKLNIHETNISDKGIVHLLGLEKLEYLNLYGTQVSDKSVMSFAALQNLKELYLWNTQVQSDHLIDSLKNEKPGLTVIYKMSLDVPFGAQIDSLKNL
jgi:hypothetical protein